jgi:RNA polymerase sigma-70 factor (ECF subfamily)
MEEIVPDDSPDPEIATGKSQEHEMLRKMLKSMNPQDRGALILRYWYEFSEEEISRSLKISVSAVKSRLFRARLRMAELWQTEQSLQAERIHNESPAYR